MRNESAKADKGGERREASPAIPDRACPPSRAAENGGCPYFSLVDGSGHKRRPDVEAGIDNKGEIRVALGMSQTGNLIPLGAWSGKSWAEIGEALRPVNGQAESRAEVVISDGEPGIAEGIAQLANGQQRCHWHQIHDLDRAMYWDKAPLVERRRTQRHLAGIIGIELPTQDFRLVSEADKQGIEQVTAAAEEKLTELVAELLKKGYNQAATYIRLAQEKLFTYVRVWLKCGLVVPRVTSAIERMMREIGRRLKRIAFGWSESGAAKMTRIIIKRIASREEWSSYWQKKLRITGKVKLTYEGAQAN